MPRLYPLAFVASLLTTGLATSSLAQPIPSPDGWVVLSVDEYRALRQRAVPPTPTPPATAPAAVLTRVDYDLRVDGESVSGRVVLTIDVMRDGWTTVTMPQGLMARDARVDGRPVALVRGKEPQVLLSRVGRSAVTLDVVMPLSANAGTEAVTVPPSSAPISRVTLAVPRSGVSLTVTDGFVAERTEVGDESRWTAYGTPNRPLTLSWKRKIDDRRSEQALRVRARVAQVVGLGEDLGQVVASVRVEVVQGLARELTLALPPGLTVNRVDGATIGDWNTDGTTLRVGLLEPTATEVAFVVQGDVRTAREGAVTIPLLRVPAAERETGGVAVDVAGSGELGGQQARGMDPTDASELGDIVAGRESPAMAAFRFRPIPGTEARSLVVNVVRYTPQAVLIANVEEARYRALASEDGRLLVEARYAVRNNQRSFLKVTLPPQSTLWSADVAGRPIRPGVADANGILLPLEKGRAGEDAPTFAVSLVYIQRTEAWERAGVASLVLPSIDLPVSRTGVELQYSPRFRLEPQAGAFRVETNLGPVSEALRRAAPPSGPVSQMSARAADQKAVAGLQALADRFRNEAGGRTSIGALPVQVAFPSFGSSIFLASELTAELQAPAMAFAFKRLRD